MQGREYHICEAQHPLGRVVIPASEAGQPPTPMWLQHISGDTPHTSMHSLQDTCIFLSAVGLDGKKQTLLNNLYI